jgi:3-oxoacyl-[acyl-carrier-protein] synthase III
LGLANCVPTFISMQQCASSLAAVHYAYGLMAGAGEGKYVIVVAFDFVLQDADRIQSFALFGDAVTSCLLTKNYVSGLVLR